MKKTNINFEIDKTSYLIAYNKEDKTRMQFYVIVTPSKNPNIISDNVKTITKKQFLNFKKLGIKEKESRGKKNKTTLKGLSQADTPPLVKTKIMPPYDKNGKTNFNIRNVPGIYQIFKNNELVYVGYSHNNLYRTMYHHFNNWNDNTNQWRVKFKDLTGIKCAVVYCKAGKVAKLLETALLLKYRPDLNKNVYSGFIADDKEKAALKQLGQVKPGIYEHKGDLPF